MTSPKGAALDTPSFVDAQQRLVAGFGARFPYTSIEGIPMLWQRFGPHIGRVPNQVGHATFGLSYNGDQTGFDYLAGVEVSSTDGLGDPYQIVTIPASRYAVFRHTGHVSGIRHTCEQIWRDWLPSSGKQFAPTPMFELYGDAFDPATASGVVEIWCPLAA
ncbi:GyrI-like domain-containing protein [Pararobbsia silviterrae]|uniref:AraC family transcriptional regulator n=1 Tax=Pararobbsia silviterrae TaxID=1792498 RepID=A0A494XIA3_9BURK|nr:GyrI-like domain-containing protein [Pararobbsia silviterrae]RKP47814.1 AraC family transcriptional regulator [Pararobbsia silviterrae]